MSVKKKMFFYHFIVIGLNVSFSSHLITVLKATQ